MGTVVEIALGVALFTVCLFLFAVLFYLKKKKQTTDDLATLAMTNLDSKSMTPDGDTRTRMGPGSVAKPTMNRRQSMFMDDSNYERIIEILKECDPEEWESYLSAFKNEKLTDDTLKLIPCDSADDSDAIWKQLLPQLGIRLAFKKQWSEQLADDPLATPGGPTPGTVIKYAEDANVELEEVDDQVLGRDTRNMDLEEEPECEGNETNFGDAPAGPQGDGDDMEMVYADAALPAEAKEPDDVVALQEAAPRAAYEGGGPPPGNFKRGVTYDYNSNALVSNESDDDEDEENMYKPSGVPRQKTKGQFEE